MSGKDPSLLLLEHHLKALKLPTVLRDYASLAAVCSQERSSFPQYLLRLVERELIDRERRATERRIKEAAFPVIKTIESFDLKVQPSINEPLVRELLRGEYIAKKENVLLVGNAGTGKTHLATALGFAACSQGKRVRFYTTTGLVTQLLEAREERTLQRLLKQLDRQDLILLDELGYVPFSKAGAGGSQLAPRLVLSRQLTLELDHPPPNQFTAPQVPHYWTATRRTFRPPFTPARTRCKVDSGPVIISMRAYGYGAGVLEHGEEYFG
jgi:hypothetical protein